MASTRCRLDWAVAAILLGVAVAYQSQWPRDLRGADESLFLYEAKRLLDGEVMYRDIFEFVTPGAWYAMSLLYWLFGVDMATARIGMAILHGAIAIVVYAAGRRLAAPPAVAVVAAMAYLGFSQPVWAFASPHWFSTLVSMVLLLLLLRDDWARRWRAAFVVGVVCGVLVMVQQQKGVITIIGVGGLLLVDQLCDWRYGTSAGARAVLGRLAALAAGMLAVVGPCLLLLMALSGFDPMFDALVRFPLFNYRSALRIPWGSQGVMFLYAYPWIPWALARMPWLLLPTAIRAAGHLVRGTERLALRRLTVLVLSGATAAASVFYYPDYIHLAFISPVFLVVAAETAAWLLGTLASNPRLTAVIANASAAALLIGIGIHMRNHLEHHRAQFPFPMETAFGRIDYASDGDRALIKTLRALLAAEPSPTLFTYPALAAPYLTADARNPTRFQLLLVSVNPREHVDEVLATLERERVPLLILSPAIMPVDDPIGRYADDHYEHVDIGEFSVNWLYKRRASPPGAESAR